MRRFIINEQQLAATLEYLGHRPFQEVEQAIAVLRQLPEYQAEQPLGAQPQPLGAQGQADAGAGADAAQTE